MSEFNATSAAAASAQSAAGMRNDKDEKEKSKTRKASSQTLKQKLGENIYKEKAAPGMEGDLYDLNEIRAQLQNPEFGKDTQERFGKFQDLIDQGGFKTNKRGRDFLKMRGLDFSRANPKPKPDPTPEPSPEPTPEPTPAPEYGNPVNPPGVMNGAYQGGTQGGDQSSMITGDYNTVSQDQNNTINNTISNSFNKDYSDNSVRSFNYNPGRNKDFEPGPIGLATAGGFFDPKISPQNFVNKYIDMNRDAQQESTNQYDMERRMTGKDDYKGQSQYAQAFDPAQMMGRVDDAVQRSYDRSEVAFNDIYGNMDDFQMPKFKMADRPDPIEDKTEETMKKYMDLLKA